MSMTIVDVREIRPIDRGEAMELATIGYERLLSLVDDLEADDWERSTDCEAWTIKDIVSHLLGEAEAFASMREFVHQFRISSREARASAIQPADAMNALQVQERSHLSPDELAGRIEGDRPSLGSQTVPHSPSDANHAHETAGRRQGLVWIPE